MFDITATSKSKFSLPITGLQGQLASLVIAQLRLNFRPNGRIIQVLTVLEPC